MDHYDDEENKLQKKMKENPLVPIGIVGMLGACAYGAYQFKNKGKMSTSVYLMQLRVAAQGMVVGTLALGVLYNLVNTHILKRKPS
ncbi:unnamed protein product [Nesidiocoris tenuis]|uniref:Hypoxia induced protein conserved region n=2 Tax=Nesidiocoris tenuis TaxID=355587 RepID=A0ABN7A6Q8_9HEMI|nr:Hypoxia induced protein conserved region [Nesidiocoris tenuis]CAB0002359.1 unnamed protein product [Nesidiocoris tenuis]